MTNDRTRAIAQAQTIVAARPVYLDTETTGTDGGAQIVEICVLDSDGSVLVDSLVKPTRAIPSDVVAVHGITNALVRDAPTWTELWPRVQHVLRGRRVAIYNAEFDLRLMQQSHRAHGMVWRSDALQSCCIMELYARFYGQWNARRGAFRWQSLADAAQQSRIVLPSRHRAQADALLAREVLHHMASHSSVVASDK